MIPVNREILTSVAVVVCLAVCIYMFRELNRAKEDVDQLKNVSTRLMHMSMPQPRPPPRTPAATSGTGGTGGDGGARGGARGNREEKLTPQMLGVLESTYIM
jgi:hypothetical protein